VEYKLHNINEALETLQEQRLAQQQNEHDVPLYMNVSSIQEELSGPVYAFIAPWKSGSGHITVRFLRTDEDIYYVVIEKTVAKPPSNRKRESSSSRYC
jgi:hypothetical protein